MGEGSLDRPEMIHKILRNESRVDGVVQNGQVIPLVTKVQVTNLITYENAGITIFNLDETVFDNISDIVFVGRSDIVGTGGLTIELYDATTPAQIDILIFAAAENGLIRTASIKAYLQAIGAGRVVLEVNIKKTGGGTAVAISCSTIEVFGS